jgi:phosphoglycerate dehydrogenase-like enzyme
MPEGKHVSSSQHIVIAKDVLPDALATVKVLAGAQPVTVIPSFAGDESLAADLAASCTVLFADELPRNLGEMHNLRWLQLASAGYEHVSGLPLSEMGVRVSNASGVNDVPIAEWCLAMMISFERDIRGLLEMQKRRGWDRPPKYQSELRGRRVGLIGYGSIGREVARLCSCLGLEIWAMSRGSIGPRPNHYSVQGTGDPQGTIPSRIFRMGQMAEFLPHLDYLILTLPLAPSTTGLIGAEELRLLPPTAVLLNPSRGRLIDEGALVQALTEEWITGAALDTHFYYPLPPEHALWSLPNVILTPHISGSTGSRMCLPRLWELFAQNLGRFLSGEPLINEIAAMDLGPSATTRQ